MPPLLLNYTRTSYTTLVSEIIDISPKEYYLCFNTHLSDCYENIIHKGWCMKGGYLIGTAILEHYEIVDKIGLL